MNDNPRDAPLDDLSLCGRPSWAWEFLRRNPIFRDLIRAAPPMPKPRIFSNMIVLEAPKSPPKLRDWGIAFAENADRPYLASPVFWRADIDPGMLTVSADAVSGKLRSDDEVLDLRRLKAAVMVLRLEDGTEYVRLVSGVNAIALEVVDGTVLNGPVAFSYHLDGFETIAAKLLTMDRLVGLWRHNRFRKRDFPLDSRRHRWRLALRALDLEAAGMSHRQIAEELFSRREENLRCDPGGRLRARVRRLLGLGHDLMNGGYLQILNGRAVPGRPAPFVDVRAGPLSVSDGTI